MTRPYTGWDANASGRRTGTEKFVQLLCAHFKNAIWNNGTWAVRAMNNANNPSKPSVHGTGRAADLSWRKKDETKGCGRYELATPVVDFLVAHSELLLIEELHDYFPQPFGRGWRCDRAAWKVYDKPTIGSAPGGDWFHVEIAPKYADDPAYYDNAFKMIASGQAQPTAPKPVSAPAPAPTPAPTAAKALAKPLKRGSKGEAVKQVQQFLGLSPVDGSFGAQTETAVKAWQTKNPAVGAADGVVGPRTWSAMFPA